MHHHSHYTPPLPFNSNTRKTGVKLSQLKSPYRLLPSSSQSFFSLPFPAGFSLFIFFLFSSLRMIDGIYIFFYSTPFYYFFLSLFSLFSLYYYLLFCSFSSFLFFDYRFFYLFLFIIIIVIYHYTANHIHYTNFLLSLLFHPSSSSSSSSFH